MVAHHTSGGCNLKPGDLFGSGTISGASADGRGALLELSENGQRPIELASGETRTFLEDGDEVIFPAHCHRECSGISVRLTSDVEQRFKTLERLHYPNDRTEKFIR